MSQKLQEVEEQRKRALLVSISDGKKGKGKGTSGAETDGDDFGSGEAFAGRELQGLAETLELEIVGHEIIRIRERNPRFGMGSGKAEELAEKAKQLEADCLVFDWDPSPSQQRNWETLAGIPVVDRQELIIRIFAERAATREADLQVQLAQLNYHLPRLTHKYIDLSRQRVLNKIDRLDATRKDAILESGRFPGSVAVSVKDGVGLKELKALLAEKFLDGRQM